MVGGAALTHNVNTQRFKFHSDTTWSVGTLGIPHQANVVAFEQNATNLFSALVLVHFLGVFQHQVHILVKALLRATSAKSAPALPASYNNLAFDFEVGVFVQPDLNARFLPTKCHTMGTYAALHIEHLHFAKIEKLGSAWAREKA